jgi:hypothetical protein
MKITEEMLAEIKSNIYAIRPDLGHTPVFSLGGFLVWQRPEISMREKVDALAKYLDIKFERTPSQIVCVKEKQDEAK